MSELNGLLSYAEKQERQHREDTQTLETQKLSFVFWTANYMLSKITGIELIAWEEYYENVVSASHKSGQAHGKQIPKQQKNKTKTSEEIMAELMPFVEADRLKGG